MRLSFTGRCLAVVMIALQLALFAYVNTALQQCEESPTSTASAPNLGDSAAWVTTGATQDHTISELRQEIERERKLRLELQAELNLVQAAPLPARRTPEQQHDAPAISATSLHTSNFETRDVHGDADGPQEEFEDAAELDANFDDAALVFDGGSQRSRGDDHPTRRFHRPLLVRFANYNATNPVRTPYGGEAARRWFQRHGYVETQSNDWDVLWCGKGQYLNFAAQSLDLPRPWQSHNHCLGAGLLAGNKHSFVTHHNIMAQQFPDDYRHVPETFDLPLQHASLLARMKEQPDEMWIFKPSTGARGEGIRLVWEGTQVPRTGRNTVQRYIEQPYLIEGRKVHLRLYVVLRDVDPLRVFLFKDGLALFASEVYSARKHLQPWHNPLVADESERNNVQVHLTNAAMMKGATVDSARDAAYDAGGDHERSRLTWTLRPFLEHLQREGKNADAVLRSIEDAVTKVVMSGQAKNPFAYRRPGTCYDLFGLDVMFDVHMHPFVLEVNLAPQLASRSRVNQMVHERLLHHLLRLTQRRPPTTETFDALAPQVFAVAEAAGLHRCTEEEEAQLAQYVKVRQPPPPNRQCVAEEDVYMVARLVDEDVNNQANLGLFTRVYPRKGSSDRYSKYWKNGESAVQKLAAAWLEVSEDTIEEESAKEWIDQLRAEDTEFETLLASSVNPRPVPAPPPFIQQQERATSTSSGKGDRVHEQRDDRRGKVPQLQPLSASKGQTVTLQQQLRQRVAERYAQANTPQPGP